MLPLPIDELTEIKSIKDTIMLGDLLIDHGILVKVKQHFGMGGQIDTCCGGGGPSAKAQKLPEVIEVCEEEDQVFEEGGLYHVVEEKPNTAILGVMFVAAILFMFAVMSIQYWPSWMIEKVWVGAKYLAYPLLGFFYCRFLIWYFFFHFGITFWILPNFTFLSSIFSPLVQFEFNTNFTEISSFLPRLMSMGALSTAMFKLNEYI